MPSGYLAPSMEPRLARRLKDLRLRSRMNGGSAAAKAGWSPSKISRIERMRAGVSVADVTLLLDIYGVGGDERDAVLALAARASEPVFRGTPRTTKASIYQGEADAVDVWGPSVVPPPLRTADYARALAEAVQDVTGMLPSEVQDMAAAALAWQRRIEDRHDPLAVRAVIDATALRRRVGAGKNAAAIMRRQVEHLAALANYRTVTLRVLPIDAAGPKGVTAFTLMRFTPAGGLPLGDVVMFDDPSWPQSCDEEPVTFRCGRAFKELTAASEPPAGAITAALAHWSR
jgi:transcriptional regulator with XRE-family HTH domain